MPPHDFKRFPELTNNQMQFYYFSSPHRQILEGFLAKVIKVTDGDTIRVEVDFRDFDFPIRLTGIDAPELKDNGGKAARDHLFSLIGNEEVYISINPANRVGKFGRLIGDVIWGGQSMSEAMLRDMRAVPFGSVR